MVSHSIFFTRIKMATYSHLAFVYLNDGKLSLQFWVCEDILLVNVKIKLNTLLRYPENYKVVKLEYHSPLIDNKRKIHFIMLELKIDDDLKVMWSTFYR